VFLQLENRLKELKSEEPILSYSRVASIAAESFGIFDPAELAQTIQFLNDSGSIIHFDTEFLRKKVVIDAQFMVDLMTNLVSVNNSFIVDGKLYHKDIGKIWHSYDSKLHSWIIKVTEKFDLTYRISNMNLNLVPCLMAETPPSNFKWPTIDPNSSSVIKEMKILYQFEYLPAGLFNRAQCRLYQMTDNEAIWKFGSLLRKNNHLALICRNETKNQIEIKVQGIHPENIIFLVHEVLECLILESFNGVVYDFLFPCPDCYAKGSIDKSNSMYQASLVRRATQMGIFSVLKFIKQN
jgi:leucine-rich repeat kinase 2